MPFAPPLLRLAVLLAAALLAVGAVARGVGESAERRVLLADLARTQIAAGSAELRGEIARAADAAAARRLLSRTLLHRALSPADSGLGDPAADLGLARELAARVLAERPASAEAATLLGLAVRLGWERNRDSALYARREEWERPLRVAMALAPGDPEPRRALAGSLLAIWYAISTDERDAARSLLREAFLDPQTFDRLLPAWVRAAWNPEVVFSIMPDSPDAWNRLEAIYTRARDWAKWRDTHRRHLEVLRRDLERQLALGNRRLADGDTRGARRALLDVIVEAPPEGRFADLAAAALSSCPAGANNPRQAPQLRGWLRWGVDRFLYGQPGFEPSALDRLAAASGDLPAETQALAALGAGQLRRAELLEERAQARWSEPWGVYLIAKAALLAGRQGEAASARRALDHVHRSWHSSPTYWRARARIAEAAGDEAARREAAGHLAAAVGEQWGATAWRRIGGRSLLEIYLSGRRGEASLTLDVVPARGAVVQVELDGSSLGAFAVSPRSPTVPLALDAEAGLHLLELRTLAGEGVSPGALVLSPTRASGAIAP